MVATPPCSEDIVRMFGCCLALRVLQAMSHRLALCRLRTWAKDAACGRGAPDACSHCGPVLPAQAGRPRERCVASAATSQTALVADVSLDDGCAAPIRADCWLHITYVAARHKARCRSDKFWLRNCPPCPRRSNVSRQCQLFTLERQAM
jgi:hypothetical protein